MMNMMKYVNHFLYCLPGAEVKSLYHSICVRIMTGCLMKCFFADEIERCLISCSTDKKSHKYSIIEQITCIWYTVKFVRQLWFLWMISVTWESDWESENCLNVCLMNNWCISDMNLEQQRYFWCEFTFLLTTWFNLYLTRGMLQPSLRFFPRHF